MCCILWNGSFRVHEILSRNTRDFDPLTTLLWSDVEKNSVNIGGKTTKALAFKIKSPMVDRVGTGDCIEIFETGLYNCPVAAFNKWKDICQLPEENHLPVFRTDKGKCLSGREFNAKLSELTVTLENKIPGGKVTSHSFRAGEFT